MENFCRYCGRPLDPQTKTCPHCNPTHPAPVNKNRMPGWVWPILAAGLATILTLEVILAVVLINRYSAKQALNQQEDLSYSDTNSATYKDPESEPSQTQNKPTSSASQNNIIVSKPASKPTSSAPKQENWKKAYKDYIQNQVDKEEFTAYALIYIDNNDVPELYLQGSCEAAGEMLCTYYNGDINTISFGRRGGIHYTQKSGKFYRHNGHMCHYPLSLCTLSNGVFHTAIEGASFLNEQLLYETGEEVYSYTLEDRPVTEEEFESAKTNWLPGADSSPHNNTMTRQEILAALS